MRCRVCPPSEAFPCDAYFHCKCRAGLIGWEKKGPALTTEEKFLVGILPRADRSQLTELLLQAAARDTQREAIMAGIRAVIDVGGERHDNA